MISVTTLSGYLYCPRKLFLEKVLGFVPKVKDVLVLGSVKHETFDAINKKEEQLVKSITEQMGLDLLAQQFKQQYRNLLQESIARKKHDLEAVGLSQSETFEQAWPMFQQEAQNKAGQLSRIMEENQVYGEELWKLLPKAKTEVWMESENLQLKGIIDRIEIRDGAMVPFELKTGKAPREGVWPGHRIQLAAYMLMLEEAFNTRVSQGYVHYLGNKDQRKITMNPFLKIEVQQLRDKVLRLLGSKTLPKCSQTGRKCAVCGLKESCYDENQVKEKLAELV